MAALSPPSVCGPLSRYSPRVRIQGLVPGSTVLVFANGSLVTLPEQATSGDQWFSLLVGLLPGQFITARQTAHPTFATSEPTPDEHGVTVMAEPTSSNDIAPLSLVSHLYHCAQCIWLDGAYPGAIVTVTDAADSFRGSTQCIDGDARIALAPPLTLSDALKHANMSVGPFSKNDVVEFTPFDSPTRGPAGRPGQLPIPVITQTIYPCQTSLPVDGAVDGALVMVRRFGTVQTISGPNFGLRGASSNCFDVPGLWFPLPTPVAPDDEFRVQQHMPSCNLLGDLGLVYKVSLDPPPPPGIDGIVCGADTKIRVSGVRPGARVEFADGDAKVPFLVAGAWADACTFLVPPGALAKLHSIKARQVLECVGVKAISSDWSAPIPVDDLSAFDDGRLPFLDPQPRSCGMIVRVRNALPGSTIYIVSDKWTANPKHPCRISKGAFVPLDKTQVDVDLDYPFSEGDHVFAEQVFCDTDRFGPKSLVLPVVPDEIGAPVIADPVPDCGSVVVRNVIPGCRVDLYTVDAFNTKTFAASRMTPLGAAYFQVPRATYDPPAPVRVVARQRACGRVSQWSNVASVVPGKVKVLEVHRLCQINGEFEDDPSLPHFTRTWTEYGITGMDLGIPVEHNGSLYLYFGDTGGSLSDPLIADDIYPLPGGTSYAQNFKSVGVVTPEVRLGVPEPLAGLRLNMITRYSPPIFFPVMDVAGHQAKANPVVSDNPDLSIGFNVPTGGFSFDGSIYLFVASSVGTGDGRPVMTQSHLIRAEGSVNEFTAEYFVDDWVHDYKFINICSVIFNTADWPELNAPPGLGLLIYGSGKYRDSDVFLAWAPLTQGRRPAIPTPDNWNYFIGLSAKGPEFVKGSRAQAISMVGIENRNPVHAATDNRVSDNFVGEFSVTWVSGLNHWLLLWGGIGAAVSRTPWGPWMRLGYDFVTDPLAGNPNRPSRDAGVVPAQWLVPDSVSHRVEGVPYGPGYGTYALQRYFRWDPEQGIATVYTLVSFAPQGPPTGGTIHLVRMDLGCEP